jgi:capsular exopolysaccharide synthesis family protein
MNPQAGGARGSAEWLKPSFEQEGLQRYVRTLRERLALILFTVVLTMGAATAYLLTADKTYEAESDLLISAVARDDPVFAGLPVFRDSSDPTRDVETAARLVASVDVARRVKERLRDPRTPDALLESIEAEPVAQSNIVAITAEADSATKAAALANAFGEAAVADRTEEFRRALDRLVRDLRARVEELPRGDAAAFGEESLEAQLVRLEALRGGNDPTLRLETRAEVPADPASPQPKLTLAAALLAGLILGIGAAFALQVLDTRLRREEQLRSLYGLPVLARIPRDYKASSAGVKAPEQLSPATIEAYRTLRATIAASRGGDGEPRSILVTSASPGEGKSTTALNLASSLALAGNRVIMIEADMRRPALGDALGIDMPEHGTGSVLLESTELRDALVMTQAYGNYLRLVLADPVGMGGWMADRLFLPAAQKLIDEAKQMADYVIIDSPPLSEVIDALPLAQRADEVLLVVRLGRTQLTKLQQLGELLDRHGVRPVGFAVVGVAATTEGYYAHGYRARRQDRDKAARVRDRQAEQTREPV